MDKIRVVGGNKLQGEINISGAKNAALPLMAACLLSSKPLTLTNLPHLADISTMASLLAQHGVRVSLDGYNCKNKEIGKSIVLDASNIDNLEAPYDIVRKMRASILVLGPLLARFGRAKVSLPGGCSIGNRPVDMHLQALKQMGAKIELQGGYITAEVKNQLQGTEISFDKVSVGASENIIMAATLAKGKTTINNAAKEPEVVDLCDCLSKMGAKIEGAGTSRIVIEGVKELGEANHNVISDRIEAGTYMIAAAITDGNVRIKNTDINLLLSTAEKLTQAGVDISTDNGDILVRRSGKDIVSTDINTQAYPGFPTDMQAQFMALMSIANGSSVISENIFENRFMHVSELIRMGADITVKGRTAIVRGVENLRGAEVMATDLRASVSLIIAALSAKGETIINRVYHIDRGYEVIEEKLASCGAEIERIG